MYACVLIVQVVEDAAPGRPKMRVLSFVNTWCFLSGGITETRDPADTARDGLEHKASLQNACDFPLGCCYYLTYLSVLLSCL